LLALVREAVVLLGIPSSRVHGGDLRADLAERISAWRSLAAPIAALPTAAWRARPASTHRDVERAEPMGSSGAPRSHRSEPHRFAMPRAHF
jgi:hypothetical protein